MSGAVPLLDLSLDTFAASTGTTLPQLTHTNTHTHTMWYQIYWICRRDVILQSAAVCDDGMQEGT